MSAIKLEDAAGKTINVMDTGEFLVPVGPFDPSPESAKKKFDYIPNFKLREDDVMLLTYPKTGTNWMYEILLMLLKKSAEPLKSSKVQTMLEFLDQEAVDNVPSPRVVDTHVPYKYLPKELKEKKIKSVLCVRNPKDMMVSYYNHIQGIKIYQYSGEWKDWFQLYMQGRMEYGMYTDYLKGFETAMAEGVGYPLHLVHYEDLKLNCFEEVKKLAKFLEVDADDELVRNIVKNSSFETMTETKRMPEEIEKAHFIEGFKFFRKGQIGDWQNWFTVAQNEQFDAYWEKEMADSKIKFTYTQSKANL